MIATIDGRVLGRGTDSIVVGLGGLGIKVFVPADLLTTVRPGDEIFLHTYLHVREQELALYGFAGEQDLAMFHLLLGVSGIGPKSALSILSAMPVDALHLAIGQEQPGVLARVPGVGKKTAEKIILELKDKMAALEVGEPSRRGVQPVDEQWREQVAAGLVGLGWSARDAEAACDAVAPMRSAQPQVSVAELLRAALQSLARL